LQVFRGVQDNTGINYLALDFLNLHIKSLLGENDGSYYQNILL
jgi:hypothetical protein